MYSYIAAFQITHFAVFNKDLIEEEKKCRKKFIEQCESVLVNISEADLKKMLLRSLANYYYWTLENEKAVEYLSTAIKLGEEDQDKSFVEANSNLLEQIKNKPNPYDAPETKTIDEMTVEEYQEITKELLAAQGITLESKDHLTDAISIGLRDMNPKEYFQHCENLHISYVTTSRFGRSIGLPSLGQKFVWCKHCKSSIAGADLKGVFNLFKQQNCQSCAFRKPRSENWNCYVNWVKKQENCPEFKRALNNFKKGL